MQPTLAASTLPPASSGRDKGIKREPFSIVVAGGFPYHAKHHLLSEYEHASQPQVLHDAVPVRSFAWALDLPLVWLHGSMLHVPVGKQAPVSSLIPFSGIRIEANCDLASQTRAAEASTLCVLL